MSMALSEEAIKMIITTAEETGWMEIRDRERDRERDKIFAKGLKSDNVPISVIVRNTKLTIQEVEAL